MESGDAKSRKVQTGLDDHQRRDPFGHLRDLVGWKGGDDADRARRGGGADFANSLGLLGRPESPARAVQILTVTRHSVRWPTARLASLKHSDVMSVGGGCSRIPTAREPHG